MLEDDFITAITAIASTSDTRWQWRGDGNDATAVAADDDDFNLLASNQNPYF